MSGWEVQRLLPNDAEAYQALRLRGLRDHPMAFTSGFEEDQAHSLASAQARLTASTNRLHDAFFGAWQAQILVGVVGIQGRYRAKERHTATIVGTSVVGEACGRGIGQSWMQALLQHARDLLSLRQLDLTVTAGHPGALHLYQRLGFAVWGVYPEAVQIDGVYADKLHMALKLS